MKIFVLTPPRLRINARRRKFHVCSAITDKPEQHIISIVIHDDDKLRRMQQNKFVMLCGMEDGQQGTIVLNTNSKVCL
jgi:hypothetical protein